MVCLWNNTSLIAELGLSLSCVHGYTNPLVSHFTFCQPAKPFSLIAPQAYVAFILPCHYAVLWHVMPFLHLHWVTTKALCSETGSWWQMCALDPPRGSLTLSSGRLQLGQVASICLDGAWVHSRLWCQQGLRECQKFNQALVLKRLSFSKKVLRLVEQVKVILIDMVNVFCKISSYDTENQSCCYDLDS